MSSQSEPALSIRDDRADTRAAAPASAPPSLEPGVTLGLPDDHHLSEYQIAIRQHLEIFRGQAGSVKSMPKAGKIPSQAKPAF
jgi:hypothetical protein